MGGPCIGTSGNDIITGSDKQDIICGLEGDDTIDPGNDAVTDYIFCGPGFDTVIQHSDLQYASEPDFIGRLRRSSMGSIGNPFRLAQGL